MKRETGSIIFLSLLTFTHGRLAGIPASINVDALLSLLHGALAAFPPPSNVVFLTSPNPNVRSPNMASCDDDFSLLGDDNAPPQPSPPPTNPNLIHHHHHPHFAALSHHFPPKLTPIDTPPSHCHPPPPQTGICPSDVGGSPDRSAGDGDGDDGDSFSDSAFCSQEVNHFNENELDPSKSAANLGREKRKEGEEFSDGGTTPYTYRKQKMISPVSVSGGGGEFRKDREEWSDTAVGCLLDVYLEKFAQLNRGNLRGKDWEEVAAYVSERSEKQTKSVEQCKNKVDNLKKRFKLELHRLNNGGSSASHWPWFSKMELIIGNSLQAKAASEDDKPVTSATKQTKRHFSSKFLLIKCFFQV